MPLVVEAILLPSRFAVHYLLHGSLRLQDCSTSRGLEPTVLFDGFVAREGLESARKVLRFEDAIWRAELRMMIWWVALWLEKVI